MTTGIIFDIKRYAIHDGPGIRTTIFMKGCPLACWWCHNPEGISPSPEVMYFEYKCIHCHSCGKACPLNAISFDPNEIQHIDKRKCNGCGICAELCPSSALKLVGKTITVEELIKEVERDIMLYDNSGGGVTFSGGEPLFQPKFLFGSLKELKKRYIHTALDTSGYAPKEVIKEVMRYTDLFLYDIKLYDSNEHKKYTGVPNDIIIQNLKFLIEHGKDVILRFPVIPGITDREENVKGWVRFISDIGRIKEINLLPFHDVSEKFRRVGREYKMLVHHRPSEEVLKWIKEEFEDIGMRVKIGG